MTVSKTSHRTKLTALFFALMTFCFVNTISVHKAKAGDNLSLMAIDRILETSKNRMWLADRSKKLQSVKEVENYLLTINQGSYNDWRLPTKQELYDLFNIFDLGQNGDVKIRLEGYYWLADDKNDSKYVGGWQIGDGCGPSRTFYKGKIGYVRAVRP